MKKSKTLYLWDAADTIFIEDFRQELDSRDMFEHISKIIGFNAGELNDREYSRIEDIEFKKGVFEIDIMPGFRELLSWTKNNVIVSSGHPSQTGFRREIILKKHRFDIMPFFISVTQVFDWNDDHDDASRNPKMFQNIISRYRKNGYNEFVYADDKLKNCLSFIKACRTCSINDYACYHITKDHKRIKTYLPYFEVKLLSDILELEKGRKCQK